MTQFLTRLRGLFSTLRSAAAGEGLRAIAPRKWRHFNMANPN